MSYLKLVNVPASTDLIQDGLEIDADYLQLDYVDPMSRELEEAELPSSTKINSSTIDSLSKLQSATQALHVGLRVSETIISFGGGKPRASSKKPEMLDVSERPGTAVVTDSKPLLGDLTDD